MQGLLGEKIGEGATADIHVWAPGQIVKLIKVDASPRFGQHEARMTRAAFAAGAPEVVDEVTLDTRGASALCCSVSTDRPCCNSCRLAP
jgi:hypothetical protein